MLNCNPCLLTVAIAVAGMSVMFMSQNVNVADSATEQQPSISRTEVASTAINTVEIADNDDAANDEIERIQVKGDSRSLIDSNNCKRYGDTVSEQLSADDLGGIPDVSMADALTH